MLTDLVRELPGMVLNLPLPVQIAGAALTAAALYGLHRLLAR